MRVDSSHLELGSIPVEERAQLPMISPPRFTAQTFLLRSGKGFGLVVMGLVCYFLFSTYLLQSVRVVGRSMSPTLADSSSYLLNRWIYLVRAPKASDIIVLRDPADNGLSVKRVIAGPGDEVRIMGGVLKVNGKPLLEPYLAPGTHTFAEKSDLSYACRRDEFFVLGDNRNNSIDSRVYGPVPRRNILGLVVR